MKKLSSILLLFIATTAIHRVEKRINNQKHYKNCLQAKNGITAN